MHKPYTILLLSICFSMIYCSVAWAGFPQENIYNPAPAEDDLVLTGPSGLSFVFRPVYLKNDSTSQFGGVKFIMGDADGGFRSPLTAVVLGGSFIPQDGTDGWVYYISKYEITQAQYDAIMLENTDNAENTEKNALSRATSTLPITKVSFFDAMLFVDKLNTWLYANLPPNMPISGALPGFVRLPTEVEWEFAARGGKAVDDIVFGSGYPYEGDELAPYEWFSGPTSSHNKVQPIGQLLPNPLGIHDMLGNVSEMTQSTYYVEYYQGRSGGFVSRGGHYLRGEDYLHAALRTEEPLYLGSVKEGMRPNIKETMGLRLVLVSPVLTDMKVIKNMENSWDSYRAGTGSALPAALSVAPISEQEAVPAQDALTRLQRVKAVSKKHNLDAELQQDIAVVEASLQSIALLRKEADTDSAKVWVKLAGERSVFLSNNFKSLNGNKKLSPETLKKLSPTTLKKLNSKTKEYQDNIDNGLINYADILNELNKLPLEAVQKGFEAYSTMLDEKLSAAQKQGGEDEKSRINDITSQRQLISIIQKHYEKFSKEKRADVPAWITDYSTNK